MSVNVSPVGRIGRVAPQGAIRSDRLGEVLIEIRGGVEAFLARDVDGGSIDVDEQIVVVEQTGPQTLLVTRLYDHILNSGASSSP